MTKTNEKDINLTTVPAKDPAFRCFEVVQYETNPLTGEDLRFSEPVITCALTHKVIKKWAYIRHDRDQKPDGSPKPPHWHVVLYCDRPQTIATIAHWFGVLPQYVEVKKGKEAFLDVAQYFTHELQPEKAQYTDDELHSNLPVRQLLTDREAKRERLTNHRRDQWRVEVLEHGKTLAQCKKEDPVLYVKDMRTLKACRLEYLFSQPVPKSRLNVYVCGAGGVGKGQTSKAIARALYPELESDEEIFYTVGAKNVSFEGYDGQPVIIWDDRRAYSLLEELGGRENVFNVFDTIPQEVRQNVKFGSVKLINSVNIVNSMELYRDFLDALSGEYTTREGVTYKSEADQKQQSYRRFPYGFEVYEDHMTFYMNSGYFNREPLALLDLDHVDLYGNTKYINRYVQDPLKRRELERQLFAEPLQYFKDALEYNQPEEAPTEDFFARFGSTM